MVADATPGYIGQVSPDGLWRWDGTAWRRREAAVRTWLDLRTRTSATWWMLIGALLAGFLADQALRVAVFGVAASAVVITGAVLLAFIGGSARREPTILLAVAALFATWLSLRASPWLVWPDLAAGLLLLGTAASISNRGSIFDLGASEAAARCLHALAHLSAGIGFISGPVTASRRRLALLGPLSRGLLIAAPIVALVSVLLASADPVFASFFTLHLDPLEMSRDGLFVAFGVLAMSQLLRLSQSAGVDRVEGPRWRLGAIEALVVLALLDTVFAAFAFAQLLALSGAAADTLRSAGVTYADYARSGFFQLLWVSGITLVVLVLFSRITGFHRRGQTAGFVGLAELAVVLTLLIVVVAFRRLSLYEEAYGFTMLRLYSHLFAGWISVLFLLFAIDVLGGGRRWFLGAGLASALALLLLLNFANPEALVVALNLDHARAAHKLDADYLHELSSDATPAILDALPQLEPALRAPAQNAACSGSHTYAPALAAYNWSDADAAAARRTRC